MASEFFFGFQLISFTGHYERLDKIDNYLSQHKLPIKLIGNSYRGVGVNDVIFSSKKAVQSENKEDEALNDSTSS